MDKLRETKDKVATFLKDHKKQSIIAVVLVCVLIVGSVAGISALNGGNDNDNNTVASIDDSAEKDEDKETVDEEDSDIEDKTEAEKEEAKADVENTSETDANAETVEQTTDTASQVDPQPAQSENTSKSSSSNSSSKSDASNSSNNGSNNTSQSSNSSSNSNSSNSSTSNSGSVSKPSGSTGNSGSSSGSSSNSGNTSKPSKPSVHTHNFQVASETSATCTSDGVRTYKCSCGQTKTETIASALGHNWVQHYTTQTIPEVFHYEDIKKYVCNHCGQQFDNAHDAGTHIMADFWDNCENYTYKIVESHKVVDQAEQTVEVPDYQYCSRCDARQ